MDPGAELCKSRKRRRRRHEINEIGHFRSDPCPPMYFAHRKRRARAPMLFVVMRQEFGFINGDVDLHGTFPFTAFTGQAQIESFSNGLALPTVFYGLAAQHFSEEPGASAR